LIVFAKKITLTIKKIFKMSSLLLIKCHLITWLISIEFNIF
jgi:hypothetical protein